ncbi:hypothetical protein F8154_07530 [Alkaliphilus pronyensis]|uniref:G5 domain-containing protein n=1 Tax=Alkaliphilus pronyensis TaxID=1482732 RepID=A0A6I0FFU5_9FIRM|nr:VanW family protein [Alkaliphilus pronyensis]KAB3534831.1 hypothetical protein F8154_07530 [Alkaliphilus pronyensis]
MEVLFLKSKKKLSVIGFIIFFIILMLIWMITLLLESPTIYSNVYIESVDVGQLTKEEALIKVKEVFQEELKNKELTLKTHNDEWKYNYSYVDFNYKYEEAIKLAYDIGREGGWWKNLRKIYGLKKNPEIIKLEASYNEEAIERIALAIENKVNIEATNASIIRKNGSFIITDDVPGYRLNSLALEKEIKARLNSFSSQPIEIPVNEIKANIASNHLKAVQDLLGQFKTGFNGADKGRNINIALATNEIDGILLMPNDVFSFNDTTGPRGVEEGYQYAPVIINGQLVPGLGGGICQVSTTLYNAVISSNLEIITRKNHSLPVAYVPLGHDATVVFEYIDLQFMNNTGYPVYIEGYIKNNEIIINIYGKKTNDFTVKLYSEVIETIQPTIKRIKDENLYSGEEKIEKEPKPGYRVNTYKLYLKEGKEFKRELISNDYYAPVNGVIIEGVKAKAPETESFQEVENNSTEASENADEEDSQNDLN